MSLQEILDRKNILAEVRVRRVRALQACRAIGERFEPGGDLDHQALSKGDAIGVIIMGRHAQGPLGRIGVADESHAIGLAPEQEIGPGGLAGVGAFRGGQARG